MEKQLENIIKKGKEQDPIVFTKKEVEKGISMLKRKKAEDRSGWKNKMVLEGGEEMDKSLTKICNKVMEEGQIPTEWEKMKVKSIFKNKGSIQEVKNRRGIFLTSIISKLFEKMLMIRTGE